MLEIVTEKIAPLSAGGPLHGSACDSCARRTAAPVVARGIHRVPVRPSPVVSRYGSGGVSRVTRQQGYRTRRCRASWRQTCRSPGSMTFDDLGRATTKAWAVPCTWQGRARSEGLSPSARRLRSSRAVLGMARTFPSAPVLFSTSKFSRLTGLYDATVLSATPQSFPICTSDSAANSFNAISTQRRLSAFNRKTGLSVTG